MNTEFMLLAIYNKPRRTPAQDTQDAKDAARYRWLRDESVGQWEHPIVVSQSKMNNSMRYIGPLSAGVLDAAVDAAIAALPEQDAQQ